MIVTGTLMLPAGPTRVRLADGYLRTEGGHIVEVHEGPCPHTADLGDEQCLIMPGFVDAHVHLPQFDSIGADGLTLLDWLDKVIYPAEAKWTDADFAAAMTGRAIARMLSHGTTAFAAYATVHDRATGRAMKVAGEVGVRCAIGQVLMDQESPPELCGGTDALIAQMRRRLAAKAGGRTETAITPRFAITCSAKLLAEAGRLARESGAIVQTHLAETREECRRVVELHGKPYTQVYADCGLLTRRSVLGHGIHLDEADRRTLAEREAIIAHCPTANTFLRSGTMDRAAHHAAGVRVALGSDIAGGPDVSMVRVARGMIDAAKYLSPFGGHGRAATRGGGGNGGDMPSSNAPPPARGLATSPEGGGVCDAVPTPAEGFAQITHVNADLLGWAHTSRIAVGSEADVLVVRPDVPWRDAPDPLGMLLYAWDERWIERVLVNGNLM